MSRLIDTKYNTFAIVASRVINSVDLRVVLGWVITEIHFEKQSQSILRKLILADHQIDNENLCSKKRRELCHKSIKALLFRRPDRWCCTKRMAGNSK